MLAAAILALGGCTGTQVKDGANWAAEHLFVMALDVAFDHGNDKPREYKPGEWTPCDLACERRKEAWVDERLAEHERRKRRAESEAFRAEFDGFMRQLDETEQQSPYPPVSVIIE